MPRLQPLMPCSLKIHETLYENDIHSYKSLRDPGAYVKHPLRGPDVFGLKQTSTTKQVEIPRKELVCHISDNLSSNQPLLQIKKYD